MSVENIDFNLTFEETPPIAMTFSENVTTPIVNWGNIIGTISTQTDLMALFTHYRTAINQDLIDALLTKKTELDNLERRVEALYNVNEGQTFDFDTDTATCYAATVPSGSVADSVTNIGGKSVVFNQLLEHGNFDVSTGWDASNGTLSVSNNKARLACTDPSASSNTMQLRRAFAPTVNHVYYCKINAVPNFTISTLNWLFNDGTSRLTKTMAQIGNTFEAIAKLTDAPTGTNYIRFRVDGMTSTSDYVDFTNAMLIDLTQMFGTGNEATALGVADFTGSNMTTAIANFKAMFPNDYYAYSTGSVVSAGVKQVDAIGKNLFDKDHANVIDGSINFSNGAIYNATGAKIIYISCESNTTYTVSRDAGHRFMLAYATKIPVLGRICCGMTKSDAASSLSITTGADAKYLVAYIYHSTYDTAITFEQMLNSVQIEKASSATAYSAYVHETVTIPQSIQSLDGYGWSAGTVYNEVDYARKKFVKRVGRVAMDTLSWVYDSTYPMFFASISDAPSVNGNMNILCEKFIPESLLRHNNGMMFLSSSKNISVFNDDYSTISGLKAYLSGVYLYYELGTPIETDISSMMDDGFLEAIAVEGGGSVSFVSDTTGAYKLPVPNTNEFIVRNSGV